MKLGTSTKKKRPVDNTLRPSSLTAFSLADKKGINALHASKF